MNLSKQNPPVETKEQTDIPLDNLKKMIQEVVSPVAQEVSQLRDKLSGSQTKTEDVIQHIKACPECYGKLWDTFKGAKFRCANDKCRMPLIQSDEDLAKADKACPHCGSSDYTDADAE